MERSTQEGGQTFDQALFQLYKEGRIDAEEALANADSANNLRIQMKNLDLRHADRKTIDDTGGLRIQGVSPDQLYRRM
jgi:twitching motility protein PilU